MSKLNESSPEIVNALEEGKQAALDWVVSLKNSGGAANEVHRLLDKNLENILLSTLGLQRDHFNRGEWTIRDRDSALGKHLRVQAAEVVDRWFRDGVELPEITAAMQAAASKTYAEHLRRSLSDLARERAFEDATTALEEIVSVPLEELKLRELEEKTKAAEKRLADLRKETSIASVS